MYGKSSADIILIVKLWKLPIRLGTKQECFSVYSIRYHTENFGQCSNKRGRNKRHTDWKGINEVVFNFGWYDHLFRNTKESNKKLKLISDFILASRCMINIKKSGMFLFF
jgi:hypothetical protein